MPRPNETRQQIIQLQLRWLPRMKENFPTEGGWQYEPNYDGSRCLAHRYGQEVHLQSRNQKPLERHFPEIARGIEDAADFVLDGELVIVSGSFEILQLRLNPAESRIRKLSHETSG